MAKDSKTKTIKSILATTKVDPSKTPEGGSVSYFDSLSDHTEKYLNKLHNVIKLLK